MTARLTQLTVALGLLLGVALPSAAAAAAVRPPTSQELAASPVPARGADPANARSYFGARYYRADLGRFTTVDPVYTWQENLTDPQRWNRYAYVRNNPLRYTDPDGRCLYPGADCGQYLLGGLKAVANIVPATATLVNSAVNLVIAPVTDFRFGAAPQFTAANADQERGMFAAQVAMAVGAVAEAALPQSAAVASPARAATVQANRAAGNAFRDEIAGALQAAGREVRTEVYKRTPFGPRVIDIDVSANGRVLGGIETKTGNSPYLPAQRAKDFWLRFMEGYPVNIVRQ
jgi:RHS repeat-associated protein